MMAAVAERQERQADKVILNKIKMLLSNESLTQKALSKKTGLSETLISKYLKNEYEGDIDKVEETLKKFLDYTRGARKYKRVKLSFVPTSISERVFNIATICQYNGEIGVCTGSAGIGKSTAIKQYAKENPGVIIVDPDEQFTARNVLGCVGSAVGLQIKQSEPVVEFTERLLKRLKGSNRLIIVDEAENLEMSCFRALRKIHDKCDFTIGLLFLGTEALTNKLANLKGEYKYLFTRFGYVDYLDKLTLKDVSELVTQVYPNADSATLEKFAQCSELNARVLFSLLKRTSDMSATAGEEINPKMVKNASNLVWAAGR